MLIIKWLCSAQLGLARSLPASPPGSARALGSSSIPRPLPSSLISGQKPRPASIPKPPKGQCPAKSRGLPRPPAASKAQRAAPSSFQGRQLSLTGRLGPKGADRAAGGILGTCVRPGRHPGDPAEKTNPDGAPSADLSQTRRNAPGETAPGQTAHATKSTLPEELSGTRRRAPVLTRPGGPARSPSGTPGALG